VALIGDRADSFSGQGGNLSIEVKAALKDDPDNRTLCMDRIYGLGGKDFRFEDAEALFNEALEVARTGVVTVPYDYHGATPGQEALRRVPIPAPFGEGGGLPELGCRSSDETNGKLKVKVPPRERRRRPKRLAPAMAPARAAASSPPSSSSCGASRATWWCSTRPAAPWW
jgi:pyruvate ferredoxin oxidoreductase alpha subunit